MRGNDGNVMLQELRDARAERQIRADVLHGLENQRMMRDDEVRVCLDGLLHDAIADIEAADDALCPLRRASDEQAGVVPVLGEMLRREAFHDVHGFLYAYHTKRSSNALMRSFIFLYFALFFARSLFSMPAAARRVAKSRLSMWWRRSSGFFSQSTGPISSVKGSGILRRPFSARMTV